MNIVLLGSVNPLDFGLSKEDYNRVKSFKFGRSVPVSDLAISLAELGHNVTVIGIAGCADSVLTVNTDIGVKLVFVPGRRQEKLKAITFYSVERKYMLSQIALLKPAIVHAHWTYEYALTAQDSGLPHVITVHDEPWEILKGFRNFYFFLRLLIAIRVRLRHSDNFVFVSKYIRTLWNKRMFATGGEVIPNMNRLSIVKSEESARLGQVLTVGNTNRGKNIRGLLAAWEIVILANPSLKLHLVGPGLGKGDPFAQKFENKFKADQVTWHGAISRRELCDVYGQCKVLVHPSKHESFGLIYLEAFSGDLGVITLLKSGSAAEVIGDAGWILDDDSPKSISDAILSLTSNQTLLNELTKKGRARLKLYSSNEVTTKYVSLYERTIDALK